MAVSKHQQPGDKLGMGEFILSDAASSNVEALIPGGEHQPPGDKLGTGECFPSDATSSNVEALKLEGSPGSRASDST